MRGNTVFVEYLQKKYETGDIVLPSSAQPQAQLEAELALFSLYMQYRLGYMEYGLGYLQYAIWVGVHSIWTGVHAIWAGVHPGHVERLEI